MFDCSRRLGALDGFDKLPGLVEPFLQLSPFIIAPCFDPMRET
jgi:hypothetical protein